MKNRALFTLTFCAAALFIFHTNTFSAAKSQRISRITIRGTDIFDLETKTYLRKFPYTWINFLHFQTKEYIIRNALLFKLGDPYDVFLLRETERNLRALSFIAAARINSFPQRDGTVALVVHVNDSWTTEPQFNVSGSNGVEKVEIGFKEKNLFGFGKTLSYFHTTKDDFSQNELGYFDPQLLGTRWQLEAKNVESTEGHLNSVKVNRPFYATDVRWSANTGYSDEVTTVEQFSNNVKVSEYKQTKEISEVAAGIKLGKSRNVVNRTGLRYSREAVDSEANNQTIVGQVLPDSAVRQTIFFDAESFRNRYVELTQLEKMTRVEDINLGAKIALSPGYSPGDLTGEKATTQLIGSFQKFTPVRSLDLILTEFSYGSRDTFANPENEKYKATMKYYFRSWPRQTVVFNNRVEWGNKLDPDNLIELGSENGLRAHDEVAFVGTRSWLVNLENRIYLIDDLWDLFSVGAAVFFDSGYAWEEFQPVSLKDMQSDAGVGLRFGLTKSSNEVVVRTDISYRMQSSNGDSAGWVLSFGTGQAF